MCPSGRSIPKIHVRRVLAHFGAVAVEGKLVWDCYEIYPVAATRRAGFSSPTSTSVVESAGSRIISGVTAAYCTRLGHSAIRRLCGDRVVP